MYIYIVNAFHKKNIILINPIINTYKKKGFSKIDIYLI